MCDMELVTKVSPKFVTFCLFLITQFYQTIKNVEKENANWNSHIASLSILLMQYAGLHFFKHFLISLIPYEGSKLINFGFLIKEDF